MNEMIFSAQSPWDNSYQGRDKKVVFVCSAGILRSATAARLYAGKYNTRACGSESYALIPLSDDLICWADQIVFVNEENYMSACRKWDLSEKNVKVLSIPDRYDHMHPELIAAFKEQYEEISTTPHNHSGS